MLMGELGLLGDHRFNAAAATRFGKLLDNTIEPLLRPGIFMHRRDKRHISMPQAQKQSRNAGPCLFPFDTIYLNERIARKLGWKTEIADFIENRHRALQIR